MAARAPGSIEPHFSGRTGKRRLLAALQAQSLVAGDATLAKALLQKARKREFQPREALTTQGAPDNDLFLIVSGSVSIRVNGREVAVRNSGNHVGEMALIDPLARRSATVVACEPTFTLQLSEPGFSSIAANYPQLWRRIASEVSSRLRERSKYIRTPNTKPVLFIGSSTEGLGIARALQAGLRSRNLVPKIWTDGVFQASRTTIESLVCFSQDTDFAALVLTPDDVTVSNRRQKKASPRDNLIFEIGLFIGVIGRDRVFILKPRGQNIKIPSDLFGITRIEYAAGGPRAVGPRVAPACRLLSGATREQGPR